MNSGHPLPIIRELADGFDIAEAFDRVRQLPFCLWLDSASRGPRDADEDEIGRYSFLTADPVATFTAKISDCDPWPTLDAWCRRLPRTNERTLPPFQGGIAGLVGYEAATWLEPIAPARKNDLPTPAIALGMYDWTIATDHRTRRSWIISQGLEDPSSAHHSSDESSRRQRAIRRADQIDSLLMDTHPDSGESDAGGPHCDAPSASQFTRCRPDESVASDHHSTRHEVVLSNFSGQGFRDSVEEIVRRICAGDSFQVNLAQRLLTRADRSSHQLYRRLRRVNAAPFGAYFAGDGFEVLSSSPEGFLKVRDRKVETRPIKGTAPRTGDVEKDRAIAASLEASEKDRAENIMIVDLMRNDLSRVCDDDSVRVRKLCEIERYEFVQHLVSVVEGRLRDDCNVADLLRACFPGGSVTGAPKIEAMRTIARLEPHVRGPYCGSIGYISCGGDADFNILIRTITATGGYWQIPVGGGITARSDPAAEEAETWAKAEGMLRAIG